MNKFLKNTTNSTVIELTHFQNTYQHVTSNKEMFMGDIICLIPSKRSTIVS